MNIMNINQLYDQTIEVLGIENERRKGNYKIENTETIKALTILLETLQNIKNENHTINKYQLIEELKQLEKQIDEKLQKEKRTN